MTAAEAQIAALDNLSNLQEVTHKTKRQEHQQMSGKPIYLLLNRSELLYVQPSVSDSVKS